MPNKTYRAKATLPHGARTLTIALETLSEQASQRSYASDLATGCLNSEGHVFAEFKRLQGKLRTKIRTAEFPSWCLSNFTECELLTRALKPLPRASSESS